MAAALSSTIIIPASPGPAPGRDRTGIGGSSSIIIGASGFERGRALDVSGRALDVSGRTAPSPASSIYLRIISATLPPVSGSCRICSSRLPNCIGSKSGPSSRWAAYMLSLSVISSDMRLYISSPSLPADVARFPPLGICDSVAIISS